MGTWNLLMFDGQCLYLYDFTEERQAFTVKSICNI